MSAEFWFNKATDFASHNSWEDALYAVNRGLQLDPTNAKHLYNKSYALLQLHRCKEAVEVIDTAISFKSNDAGFWNHKGYVLLQMRQFADAVSAFNEATRLNPRDENSWHYKAIALVESQQYREAVVANNEAIRLNLTDAKSWHNKGVALLELSQHLAALQAFEESIRLDPARPAPWVSKGNTLAELRRYSEALEAYNESIRLEPENSLPWGGKGSVLAEDRELFSNETALQCIYRSAYLALKHYDPNSIQHILFLLNLFQRYFSLPLLTKRLLRAFDLEAGTVLLSELGKEIQKGLEPACKAMTLVESASNIDGNAKALWLALIAYYYGDAPAATDLLKGFSAPENMNMMGQYYLLVAFQAYLEPCEDVRVSAVKKACLLANDFHDAPIEQIYYAALILFSAGEIDEALKCFSCDSDHLPSLYMRWYCLNKRGDPSTTSILQRILERECELQRQGICGYLLPQTPPELDTSLGEWEDRFLFYIHFH